jgi:hypothetical protein
MIETFVTLSDSEMTFVIQKAREMLENMNAYEAAARSETTATKAPTPSNFNYSSMTREELLADYSKQLDAEEKQSGKKSSTNFKRFS